MEYWLSNKIIQNPENEAEEEPKIGNAEIPILNCYDKGASEVFWKIFPKRELPEKAETKIDIKMFEKEIGCVKHLMQESERRRADKVIRDLRQGADAYQKTELPPIEAKNANSALENGVMLTDKIATWIKKGFVAGPFDCPPVDGFRCNPLSAIKKNGKIRPILNMSGPIGRSFNDNIEKIKMEKLHMSTAKAFGQELKNMGERATFSKFDICDAYKLIPIKKEDYRLQGFHWLGKYFVETQSTFGGANSPSNFDRLSNTKDLVVSLKSGLKRDKLFRVLDDTPVLAKKDSKEVEIFSKEMRNTCRNISLPLAEKCCKKEKAFENENSGTVLGIEFDSVSMTWKLPKLKADRVISRCLKVVNNQYTDLKEMQKLMGSVNDVAQMSPFLKFHVGTGNRLLCKFQGNENIQLQIEKDLKEDLLVVANLCNTARHGLPLAEKISKPSLSALVFYTDAAGARYSYQNKKKVVLDNADRGVSCVGGTTINNMWGWSRVTWPDSFLSKKDNSGIEFGSKSSTLEAVGLLIPFLAFPEKVVGKNVIFMIDNMAVVYGWDKGYVKGDKNASDVLKAVCYLSSYLGTTVFVNHVPRKSDSLSELADELTRRSDSACSITNRRLKEAVNVSSQEVLSRWFEEPNEGKSLRDVLLAYIKGAIPM